MRPLWTSAEASEATGGKSRSEWAAKGVSIDTRTMRPGDLFVALRDSRDGHDFAAEALRKGAAAAMVSRRPNDVPEGAPLLMVEDVLEGLRGLAAAARARGRAKVIALTGSVGKTSTKDMLERALAKTARVHASEKSFNNHWGVPLTLARLHESAEAAVIEIGMSGPGEIAPLSKLARPHVGVVTAIGAAHLGAFSGLEDIAREKAGIFAGLEPGGHAILPADAPGFKILEAAAGRAGAKALTFGEGLKAAWRVMDIMSTGEQTVAKVTFGSRVTALKLSAAGRHFMVNAVAALAACEAAGFDPAIAAMELSGWKPVEGRGTRELILLDEVETDRRLTLIDDAYNANPMSMASAFEVLAQAKPMKNRERSLAGSRVAVLGDMLELGGDSPRLHADLASLGPVRKFDTVHCVGALMKSLHAALPEAKRGVWCAEAEEMAGRICREVRPGDVILVKGSKGSRVSSVARAIRALDQSEKPRETANAL